SGSGAGRSVPGLHQLPPAGENGADDVLPPPPEGGPGAVQRLPRPPRWQRPQRPHRGHPQRHLLPVPRRQAGSLPVRTRAGTGRLRPLPPAPRLGQRPPAEGPPAHALPAVPYRFPPPGHGVRFRAADAAGYQYHRPVLHQLSQPGARRQPARQFHLQALGEARMTDRRGIKALIVSLALVPLPASAGQGEDVRAWLELGAGAASHGNGRFGEFREPLRDDALFGLGSPGITGRDALDPYRSVRLVAESSLPGLALDADYRRQGEYQIGFDYRHFESLSREDYTTVFPTRGTDLVLPPGYGGAAGAERFRGDAGVRRESGNLELQRQLGAWHLRADLGRDLKEGSRILGASERFGDAALLAAPIDQRHDTLDLGAQYLGEGWRVNTAWYYSSFSNDARFLSYQNPINLAAPVRTLDTGPDNEFSRVSVDGSYQFSPTRQLSWFVARGDARQNENFLQSLVVAGQPLVASLDARRVDRDLRLGYRGRVNPRLDYRLQWDYRERDNRGQPLLYA